MQEQAESVIVRELQISSLQGLILSPRRRRIILQLRALLPESTRVSISLLRLMPSMRGRPRVILELQ